MSIPGAVLSVGSQEIKERRPAMMLSELIDCRRRALQQEASESRSATTNNPESNTALSL
jgi:hypothetical protein